MPRKLRFTVPSVAGALALLLAATGSAAPKRVIGTVGSRDKAIDLARQWVTGYREILTNLLSKYTREDLVRLVEQYRDEHAQDELCVEAWLRSEYEPMWITGEETNANFLASKQAA